MVTFEIRLDRLLYGLLVMIVFMMVSLMQHAPDIQGAGNLHKNRIVRHVSFQEDTPDTNLLDILNEPKERDEPKARPKLDERNEPALPVRCETLIQQPDPIASSFTKYEKTDLNGGDLYAVHTKDIGHLQRICDAIPECVAFNSNGWLKKSIGVKYKTKSDVYIKDGAQEKHRACLSAQIIEDNYGKDYIRMMDEFRVYIYNIHFDANITTVKDYKYGVEPLFISLLQGSRFKTQDPEQAHMFFIPSRCTSYRKSVLHLQEGIMKAREIMKNIIFEIKKFPYWERSLGVDHFYICAHDMGTDLGLSSDDNLIKNSIALVNTADYEERTYIPHKDISLPPHPAHGQNSFPQLGKGGLAIDPANRTILAFFAGTIDRGRIRPTIQKQWSKDKDFRIFMGQMSKDRYIHHLKTSKFCLCLRGNEGWSPRLMDALWFGCIPVIISDYYELPLSNVINWKEIAVFVLESQFEKLKDILLAVTAQEIESMQHKIKQVYAHLTWNDPPLPYDAFHSVMFQVWQRRNVIRYV